MSCTVIMRGLLEPIQLEDGFLETAHMLNSNAAQGKEFVVTRKLDGGNIILKLDSILTITENEEDWEGVPSAI